MKYILLLLLFIPNILLSQDTLFNQLTTVKVTDNRLSIPFKENVHSITVIDQKQIQSLPAHSISEVIQHFGGIDVRHRGVHGIQADISIRGSSFDQVLILLDGIPMIDPQTGHHSFNLPLSKNAIQRIEIIKGSASRIYGPNAFAGAINIITKTTNEPGLSTTFEAGSFGFWKGAIHAALPKSGTSLSLSTQASDGYKYNTDYQLTNGFISQNWNTKKAYWKLMAGMTFRKFGANGFYASPAFTDQYEEIQTSFTSLQLKTKVGAWSIAPRIYWRRNQDMYLFIRLKPEVYRNMHINNTLGVEINSRLKKDNFTTGIGLTANSFYLRSNNLGKRKRSSLGLFVEERIQLFNNQLDIIPGFNLHYYSDFGAKLFPGLDIGWHFNDHFKAFANMGYTWRVPTYTDLYYESPANLGNPDLKPESALTFELGSKYHQANWNFATALFKRNGSQIIDWTQQSDTAQWQPNNFNFVNTSGLEIETEWHPKELPIRLSANYTYLQTTFRIAENLLSRYTLSNLRHQVNTSVNIKFVQKSNLKISYRWLDRVSLPNYDLLDVKFSWPFRTFTIFAQANNVLDERYTETNLVEMPGFWFSAGLRFQN